MPPSLSRRFALAAITLPALVALPAVGQAINEDTKLPPSDGAAGDEFGWSVAISGTTAVVGAYLDDDNGNGSGSAYLFDATTGQQIAKLLPADGAVFDLFGISVAISDTATVIGASGDASSSGSAYLFDTTTGQQIAKLLPADGAIFDLFGNSVAISGTTAVVGAYGDDDNGISSGSAYLFDTTTGQQIAKLLPADGEAGDEFGFSVAISGTTAVIGAVSDGANGNGSGSVYLFDTNTGQQFLKLLPHDGFGISHFGISVAISGTTALVGAIYDNGPASSGAAYLFDTTTGQQIAKLLPTDGVPDDQFGFSVAIYGTTAVVGAIFDDDNGESSGSAYLFNTATGQQIAKLLPSDGAVADQFGGAVAICSTTVVVGARFDDDNGDKSGSAYIFTAAASSCPADLAEPFGGVLNLQDVFAYLALFNDQDPAADLAAPFGTLNLQDVFAYLALFNAGCP